MLGCLRAVAAGGRRLILVEGEPGIGKTRSASRSPAGCRTTTSCSPRPATTRASRRSARSPTRSPTCCSSSTTRSCACASAGGRRSRVGRARTARAGCPTSGRRLQGDVLLRAEQVRRALVSCLTALSRRAPILLVLDDLHRAGPGAADAARRADEGAGRTADRACSRRRAHAVADRSSRLAHLAGVLAEADDLIERITARRSRPHVGDATAGGAPHSRRRRHRGRDDARAHRRPAVLPRRDARLRGDRRAERFEHLPTRVLDFVRYRVHALGPIAGNAARRRERLLHVVRRRDARGRLGRERSRRPPR